MTPSFAISDAVGRSSCRTHARVDRFGTDGMRWILDRATEALEKEGALP